MNCKNCKHELKDDAQFCETCGAKVVKSRITLKELILLFLDDVFGVDSRFFRTLKEMAIHPDKVLNEYLSGVRKRYINPFGFFAIAVGISLLVFNFFEDDFLKMNSEVNKSQVEQLKKDASIDLEQYKDLPKAEFQAKEIQKKGAELQLKFLDNLMKYMLNYYNIVMFLFLPVYALLSKWTYPKPHNYGEHIIMNTYILSFTVFITLLFFGFALLIHPRIYNYSILFTIVFYLFAFGKLYQKTWWQSFLKLLKFLLGFLIVLITLIIIISIILVVLGFLGFFKI